ncbi:hypothetical protein ACP4OV_025641 [Aristida adscensionis]
MEPPTGAIADEDLRGGPAATGGQDKFIKKSELHELLRCHYTDSFTVKCVLPIGKGRTQDRRAAVEPDPRFFTDAEQWRRSRRDVQGRRPGVPGSHTSVLGKRSPYSGSSSSGP